jgi:hypothetical protein
MDNIDRNSGSDHAIVGLRLDIPTQGITTQSIQHSQRTRLRWHKADWKKFDIVIKDSGFNTSNLGTAEETNRAVTSIRKILTNAVDEAVPREEILPKQVL